MTHCGPTWPMKQSNKLRKCCLARERQSPCAQLPHMIGSPPPLRRPAPCCCVLSGKRSWPVLYTLCPALAGALELCGVLRLYWRTSSTAALVAACVPASMGNLRRPVLCCGVLSLRLFLDNVRTFLHKPLHNTLDRVSTRYDQFVDDLWVRFYPRVLKLLCACKDKCSVAVKL